MTYVNCRLHLFFSSRRRHTRLQGDWSSDVCSSDLVLGGSGQGEQIVANKVRGVRAALCNDLYLARLSRAHNDANVIGIGARIVAPAYAMEIVRAWLATPFDGGRHAQRVEQIAKIEGGEL